jgi:hypothetical protein
MGMLVGFVVGYLVGSRAGREGLEELTKAWATIRESDEFKALTAATAAFARRALDQGGAQAREAVSRRLKAV